MKYLNLIILLSLCVGLNACKKKETTSDNIQFNVNGITDVKIPANGSGMLTLAVTHTSGNQETVTLSINGLPDKVTSDFSTSSGIPTFSSDLNISADYAAVASHPVTIVAKSASGVTKNYNFNLVIEPYTDCAAQMVGRFDGSYNCGGGPNNAPITITKDPGKPNGIFLNGVYSDPLAAVLDCNSQKITIEDFVIKDGTYETKGSGSGTFLAPSTLSFTLNTTFSINGSTPASRTCTYTFVR